PSSIYTVLHTTPPSPCSFFFNHPSPTPLYTLSLHDALPIFAHIDCASIPHELFESELFGYEKGTFTDAQSRKIGKLEAAQNGTRSEEHTSELQSLRHLVCRLLLEKKKKKRNK